MADSVQPDVDLVTPEQVNPDFLSRSQRTRLERQRFEAAVLQSVRVRDAVLDGVYKLALGARVGASEVDYLEAAEGGGVVVKVRGDAETYYIIPESNVVELVWRAPVRKAKVLKRKSDRPVAKKPKRSKATPRK